MKKNIPLLLISLLCITADATAQDCCDENNYCCIDENTNFYAKIFSGANFLQNSTTGRNRTTYQTGYILDGSLGYSWRYGLSVEAEYAFRRNAIEKMHFFGGGVSKHGHFQTSSYMANLLWDLPVSSWGCVCWNLEPFIGAGIGYDFEQMHASNSRIVFNQKWHHLSWQAMVGLAYPIFCNTEITLEYKFHQGGCQFNNHSLGIGLIYKFF